MNYSMAAALVLSAIVEVGCGSRTETSVPFKSDPTLMNDNLSSGGSGSSVDLGSGQSGSSLLGPDGGTFSVFAVDGGVSPASIAAIIRDFRFYDPSNSTTVPDFENPPNTPGSWDDKDVVTNTLGADNKPVYKNATGTTLTTHGKADFDKWYNDIPGTNIHVNYPLPLTQNADGSFGYDSQVHGVPYNIAGMTGNGFFPIDDHSPYATMFGNQGEPHNYSFTMEIHTVFRYAGGEYFHFRGDDDIFVYINKALVINLGGIHAAETGSVNIDTLGLTAGQTYPLDFFSAERHVTGSNIEFTTTLALQQVSVPR